MADEFYLKVIHKTAALESDLSMLAGGHCKILLGHAPLEYRCLKHVELIMEDKKELSKFSKHPAFQHCPEDIRGSVIDYLRKL